MAKLENSIVINKVGEENDYGTTCNYLGEKKAE